MTRQNDCVDKINAFGRNDCRRNDSRQNEMPPFKMKRRK